MLNVIMLDVSILIAIMVGVIMLNVILVIVVAPPHLSQSHLL
jgi:hypothetical protein